MKLRRDWLLIITAALIIGLHGNGARAQQQRPILEGRNIQPPRIAPGAKPENAPPLPPQLTWSTKILLQFRLLEQAFMALNQRVIDNSNQLHIMHRPDKQREMMGVATAEIREEVKAYDKRITDNKDAVEMVNKELGYLKNSNDNMQQRITNLEDLQKQQASDIQAIRDLVENMNPSVMFNSTQVVHHQQQNVDSRTNHQTQINTDALVQTSNQVALLSMEVERLSSRMNNTGANVHELTTYVERMSSDLDDLEKRSKVLKVKTDSNERQVEECSTLRTDIEMLRRDQSYLARNTTAALMTSRDQLRYNPAIVEIRQQVNAISSQQIQQQSSIAFLTSTVNEVRTSTEAAASRRQVNDYVEQQDGVKKISAGGVAGGFIDPETGHEINVVDLASSIKLIEESLRSTRDDQLIKFDGMDENFLSLSQDVTELRRRTDSVEITIAKQPDISGYLQDLYLTIDELNMTVYEKLEAGSLMAAASPLTEEDDATREEYVTMTSLESRDFLMALKWNETVEARLVAAEKRTGSLLHRAEKRIRETVLAGAEFTRMRDAVSRIDQLGLDVRSLNTSLQQEMTLLNDGLNRFGSYFSRLRSLEGKAARRSEEVNFVRDLMMNATQTLSAMSMSIAEHKLDIDSVNDRIAGYDQVLTVLTGINFQLQYDVEVLNRTVKRMINATSANMTKQQQEWKRAEVEESSAELRQKLLEIEAFYQDLKHRLDLLDEMDVPSDPPNNTGLATTTEMEELGNRILALKSEVQLSTTEQVRSLAKEHLSMLDNQRRRIRILESQEYGDFVRRKDLTTLNNSLSSEVTSLNFAIKSAVENVNSLQQRIIALEITDYAKADNISTPEVDFEFPIQEDGDYWLENKSSDDHANTDDELKEMSNILKIVQSQIQLIQQSTSTIEDMRSKVETLAPLKNLVVRNSDSVTNLDAAVASLQTLVTEATNQRLDVINKHQRLQRRHDDLRSLVNETRIRLDHQDDLTNKLRRRVATIEHATHANISMIRGQTNAQGQQVASLQQSLHLLSQAHDQTVAKQLSMVNQVKRDEMQTEDYRSMIDEKMVESEMKIMIQGDLLTNITYTLHQRLNQPALTESNPILKRALSGVRASIRDLTESRDQTRDQLSALTRADGILQTNLTHLNEEQANMYTYMSGMNVKCDQLADSLVSLADNDRYLENSLNMMDQRITAQTNTLTLTQQDVQETEGELNELHNNIKNHDIFIRRIEQAVEKHNSDITFALESFSNQSITIHKLRRKIKTAPSNPQSNITDDILSELEILSQRHEELENSVTTLKQHRTRDKQSLDETKRIIAGFSYASFTQQVQRNANERIRLRDELGQKIRQLEIKSNEQKTSVADLETVVLENRNKWSILDSVSSGLDSVRDEVWSNFLDHNNRTQALKKALNAHDRRLNDLRGRVTDHDGSLVTIREERMGLEHTLQSIRSDSSSTEQILTQITQDIGEITEKINEIKKEQGTRRSNVKESLRDTISLVEQKVVTNENKIARLQETSSSLATAIETARQSIETRDNNEQSRNIQQTNIYEDLRNQLHNSQQLIRNVQEEQLGVKQRINQLSSRRKSSQSSSSGDSSDESNVSRSSRRRSGISQSDLQNKLELYVTKKLFDEMVMMFQTEINNMSMNVEELRVGITADSEMTFTQIRKSLRSLDKIQHQIASQDERIDVISNTTSADKVQLKTEIDNCLEMYRVHNEQLKSIQTSLNIEGPKDGKKMSNITSLLGNFSSSLEELRERLQAFQTPPTSADSTSSSSDVTEDEELSKYEIQFDSFRGEVEEKLETMRNQVNLVIRSINNARQSLGRKSDIDHIHEDQQEKFQQIELEVTKVRSNVSSLIRDITEVRKLASKEDQKEKYNSLMQDIVELHSTVEQFDFMIDGEVTKLRMNIADELTTISDSVADNKRRIERLKTRLDTPPSGNGLNTNFTMEGSRARRLLASVAELTSKLESYSVQTRDILNENADFVGYQIYSEVNPSLTESDVVDDSTPPPASKNIVEAVVVNTLDAFLSMLNDVTSLILENGGDLSATMTSSSTTSSASSMSSSSDPVGLKVGVETSAPTSAEKPVAAQAQLDVIEALKHTVSKLNRKTEKNGKEIRAMNENTVRTNELLSILYYQFYDIKTQTSLLNESISGGEEGSIQETMLSALKSSQSTHADQISLIQEQQVLLMQTMLNETDKLEERIQDVARRIKREVVRSDDLIKDEVEDMKVFLNQVMNQVYYLNNTILEDAQGYASLAELNQLEEDCRSTGRKLQTKSDEMDVYIQKQTQIEKSVNRLKEGQTNLKLKVAGTENNLTMFAISLEHLRNVDDEPTNTTEIEEEIQHIWQTVRRQVHEANSIRDSIRNKDDVIMTELRNMNTTLLDYWQDIQQQTQEEDETTVIGPTLTTTINNNKNAIIGMEARITTLRNMYDQLFEVYSQNRNEARDLIYAQGKLIEENSFVTGNNSVKIRDLQERLKTHGTVSVILPNMPTINEQIYPQQTVNRFPQPATTTTTAAPTTTTTTTARTTTTPPPTTTTTTASTPTNVNKVFPPSGLRVVSDDPMTIMVSWTPSRNAQQYRVILKAPNRPPEQIDTTKSKVLYTHLKPDTKYIVSLYSMRGELLSRPLNMEVITKALHSPLPPDSGDIVATALPEDNRWPSLLNGVDDNDERNNIGSNNNNNNQELLILAKVKQELTSIPKTPTFKCYFESPDICGFQNGTDADFTWDRTNTSTSSADTGPEQDHTYLGSDVSGYYMYIEASRPRTKGQRAQLISPPLQPTKDGQCLEFFYHMYGGHIGSLNVSMTYDNGLTSDDVWFSSGDQGNQWREVQMTIHPNSTFQLIIEAVRGIGYKGDAAFDDIKLYSEPCPSVFFFCDFEAAEICGFEQDKTDDFDWDRHHAATPSAKTGPNFDHTYGQLGHFMYIETSNPRLLHDYARLTSPVFTATPISGVCLQFWYHMYGTDIGSLNVFLRHSDDPSVMTRPIWSKIGEQGKGWLFGQVGIISTEDFQIVFEGIRGSDYKGDIAIDDISLHKGLCSHTNT